MIPIVPISSPQKIVSETVLGIDLRLENPTITIMQNLVAVSSP